MVDKILSEEMGLAKSLVNTAMEKHPLTRNSDTLLLLRVWADQGAEIHISRGLFSMARPPYILGPETVTRARRVIQNDEGRLLPTDPQVLIRRRVREEQIRAHFSGNPRIVGEWQALRYGVG